MLGSKGGNWERFTTPVHGRERLKASLAAHPERARGASLREGKVERTTIPRLTERVDVKSSDPLSHKKEGGERVPEKILRRRKGY